MPVTGNLLIPLAQFSCATFKMTPEEQPAGAKRITLDSRGKALKEMAHLDVRLMFKRALERLKEAEKVSDNDPSLENLKGQVVRSIAELEVAHLGADQPSRSSAPEPEVNPGKDEEPPSSAAA